jgi:3-deoxy-7-phosphoheptulonate synthase
VLKLSQKLIRFETMQFAKWNAKTQTWKDFALIAGPCAIESYDLFLEASLRIQKAGATALRGGIFKPRTNPKSFQGLGLEAIAIAKAVKQKVSLPLVSEITDPRQLDQLYEVVDVFQVGARNMHNYELLKTLSKIRKPVLLKRGFCAYVDELLLAAEYLVQGGNTNVILCERGIRTFERNTRNTLDLASVAYLKQRSSFPVLVDPSHATGVRSLIPPMAFASAASGADGVMIEVHPKPDQSLSDAEQALSFEQWEAMLPTLEQIAQAVQGAPPWNPS